MAFQLLDLIFLLLGLKILERVEARGIEKNAPVAITFVLCGHSRSKPAIRPTRLHFDGHGYVNAINGPIDTHLLKSCVEEFVTGEQRELSLAHGRELYFASFPVIRLFTQFRRTQDWSWAELLAPKRQPKAVVYVHLRLLDHIPFFSYIQYELRSRRRNAAAP